MRDRSRWGQSFDIRRKLGERVQVLPAEWLTASSLLPLEIRSSDPSDPATNTKPARVRAAHIRASAFAAPYDAEAVRWRGVDARDLERPIGLNKHINRRVL